MGILFCRPLLGIRIYQIVQLLCLFGLLGFSLASAQEGKSGLSANRLKLPKGPGSIEGVGEDAEVDINMGLVSYRVPFAVPSGYEGMSPGFSLGYAASSGNGPVGIGWSLSGGARIERQTSKGLPEYNAEDGIVAFGGTELVLLEEVRAVGQPVTRKYRARYEGGFSLYTWFDDSGDGQAGYWMVESPDGKVSYFGANRFGETVQDARLEAEWMEGAEERGGTFSWELVEQIDLLGHRMVYGYEQHGGRPYLHDVRWVMRDDETSRYKIAFEYEEREDKLSDGKPGVEVRWERRLSEVLVSVNDARLRSYQLQYESMEESGGISRLTRVQQFGMNEAHGAYPIEFQFAYTGTFDPVCNEEAGGMGVELCSAPQVHQVGSVGVDFATGRADLIDINGDALPDVVDTSDEGGHRLFVQTMDRAGDGDAQAQMMVGGRFMAPVTSQLQTGAFRLTSPQVHMVDLDGNGRSDMVDGANESVLFNEGEGDWHEQQQIAEMRLPALHQDENAKFFDVNGDHRIDVIRIGDDGAFWYENLGHWDDENTPAAERGFKAEAQLLSGIPNNIGFAISGLQLADMNGDGLQDLVQPLLAGAVQYYLNLGWGRFSGDPENPQMARTMGFDCPPAEVRDCAREQNAGDGQAGSWELTDINGDGLSDLVRIVGISIEYALNRGGQSFSPITLLEGNLPEREAGTSIRFADMNGSGSTDIVYIDSSGMVQYVELFARRPNLLSKVENGIGKVIELTYGTSVTHMARDGGPEEWRYRLPHPMLVLEKVVSYDTLSEVKQIQEYHYKHGYYDGTERQFRGFEYVEVYTHGDASMEPGKGVYNYEVGSEDPYRKGLLLEQETFSNNEPLSANQSTYEDCPLTGIPEAGTPEHDELKHPIRYVCTTRSDTILKERRPENEWVTLRAEQFYDGYGNVLVSKNSGVISIGGQGCTPCEEGWDENYRRGEACGQECLGDEQYEQTWFIEPSEIGTGGKWILRAAHTKRAFGVPDSPLYTETKTYYDGEDFIGLEHGRLRQGLVKRTTQKKQVGSNDVITTERFAHNEHGNIIQVLDANDHKRSFAYDEEGVLLNYEQVHFDDPTIREDGSIYNLRQTVTHHPVLETVLSSTAWQRVEGEAIVSEPRPTAYAYDTFGRITAIAKPGDTLEAPSQIFEYDFQDPVSRLITKTRTEAGGFFDQETIECFDGQGKSIQKRRQIENNLYQVSGFSIFNIQGEESVTFIPYQGESGTCDLSVPDGLMSTKRFFDSSGRVLGTLIEDGALYDGVNSENMTQYGPLWSEEWDEEDVDPGSIHHATPMRTFENGLGQVTRIDRLLSQDSAPIHIYFRYDALGRLNSLIDHEGNQKRQSYDLLGRVTRVRDPNSGETLNTFDDAGNILSTTDARGVVTQHRYDEANRSTLQWEDSNQASTQIEWTYDATPEGVQCEENTCEYPTAMLTSVSYPLLYGDRATDVFGYDERGRGTHVTMHRSGMGYVFRSEYDNADQLVRSYYPGGFQVERELDALSRVQSIEGYLEEVTYNAQNQVSSFRYANQIAVTRQFDLRMRNRSLRIDSDEDENFYSLEFHRNRIGHITNVSDLSAQSENETEYSERAQYVYDNFYRLVEARLDEGRDKGETLQYTYSSIENLTRKTSSLGADSPVHIGDIRYAERGAGPHAMSSAANFQFQYDAAGQMLTQSDMAQGNGAITHEWNFQNRITRSQQNGKTIAEYGYDAAAERSIKLENGRRTDYLTSDFEIRDGMMTLYIKNGGHRIAKVESDALAHEILTDLAPCAPARNETQCSPDESITIADAWVLHAHQEEFLNVNHAELEVTSTEEDKVTQLLHASAHRLLLGEDGEAVTYFHQNHIGSTALSSNEHGEVLERIFYYPYGEIRNQPARLPDYSFTGKERDQVTGLSYHSARHLHTLSGRWISPDPMFLALGEHTLDRPFESVNAYAYTLNNPISYHDPSGEFLNFIAGAVAGAAMDAGTQFIMMGLGLQDEFDYGSLAISATAGAAGVGIVSGVNKLNTAYKVYKGSKKAAAVIVKGTEIASEAALSAGETYARGEEVTLGTIALDVTLGKASEVASGKLKGVVGNKIHEGVKNGPQKNLGGKPKTYVPDRILPTDKHGVPIPDTDVPHTQLGKSKEKYGSEPQAREWDYGSNGNLQPMRDIDFTNHGTPQHHPHVPHQHKLTPNNPDLAPKGGYQRGPGEPL